MASPCGVHPGSTKSVFQNGSTVPQSGVLDVFAPSSVLDHLQHPETGLLPKLDVAGSSPVARFLISFCEGMTCEQSLLIGAVARSSPGIHIASHRSRSRPGLGGFFLNFVLHDRRLAQRLVSAVPSPPHLIAHQVGRARDGDDRGESVSALWGGARG